MRRPILGLMSVAAFTLCSIGSPVAAQEYTRDFTGFGKDKSFACGVAKNIGRNTIGGDRRIVRFSSCDCVDSGVSESQTRWRCSVEATIRRVN